MTHAFASRPGFPRHSLGGKGGVTVDAVIFWATLAFSVFGFVCALRMLLECLFGSAPIAVAVEVREKKDADMLDMLLHQAVSAFFIRGGRVRPVVLISTALMDGEIGVGTTLFDEYWEVLERFGAECYLVGDD